MNEKRMLLASLTCVEHEIKMERHKLMQYKKKLQALAEDHKIVLLVVLLPFLVGWGRKSMPFSGKYVMSLLTWGTSRVLKKLARYYMR